MNNKTLIFEGAGWPEADSSKATDVTNCRIRTRIRNNDGRLIYLELGGTQVDKKRHDKKWIGYNYEFFGYVDSCYYADSEWDSRRNLSSSLRDVELLKFEYNKSEIIKLVNEHLNCSFDDMVVINDGSVHVHNNNDPLCDCSKQGYEPHKDIKYLINELPNEKSTDFSERYRVARYPISYDFIMSLPSTSKYIKRRAKEEQKDYSKIEYRAIIEWDSEGVINDASITANDQHFPLVGVSYENLIKLINEIISYNSKVVAV